MRKTCRRKTCRKKTTSKRLEPSGVRAGRRVQSADERDAPRLARAYSTRSKSAAMPIPPPMHSAAIPSLTRCCCIWCKSVVAMRAPLAPTAWPRAMAPPWTLTLSQSQSSSRPTAKLWAANASLSSMRSTSSSRVPVWANSLRIAGAGPIPIMRGSTPALAVPRI